MARLAKTKESKRPVQGAKLHPVKLEKSKKKAPDGSVQMVAVIGTRKLALGRVKDPKDDRDRVAKLSAVSGPVSADLPDYKYWGDNTWRGDQNGWPHCVAYSALHRVENSPLTYTAAGPVVDPKVIYDRAQLIDEWPGTNYDGTSVRAGGAAVKERGFVSEYQRITSFGEFIDFLRRPIASGGGPILIGIDWTEDMFAVVYLTDALGDGRWMVVPTGALAGGHAILVNGVSVPRQIFRLLNSWGTSWGVNGRASIRFSDMEDLLFNRGGDAWRYVEVRPS
jgi:hypothetical protein